MDDDSKKLLEAIENHLAEIPKIQKALGEVHDATLIQGCDIKHITLTIDEVKKNFQLHQLETEERLDGTRIAITDLKLSVVTRKQIIAGVSFIAGLGLIAKIALVLAGGN